MFFIEKCIMHLVDALEDLRALKREAALHVERRQRFPALLVSPSEKIDPRVLRSLMGRLTNFKGPIESMTRINAYSKRMRI